MYLREARGAPLRATRFSHDKATGLKAIIAIHDTTLGPALGDCRMWPYASEEEAVIDALRLARGMIYKAAASGLNLGGGKSVIIGDPHEDKTEALFRSLGRYILTLPGRTLHRRRGRRYLDRGHPPQTTLPLPQLFADGWLLLAYLTLRSVALQPPLDSV